MTVTNCIVHFGSFVAKLFRFYSSVLFLSSILNLLWALKMWEMIDHLTAAVEQIFVELSKSPLSKPNKNQIRSRHCSSQCSYFLSSVNTIVVHLFQHFIYFWFCSGTNFIVHMYLCTLCCLSVSVPKIFYWTDNISVIVINFLYLILI